MGRIPCCDMMGVKKGPWTLEEDRKLVDYIQKHGFGNWRALPKQAGVMRCGKSCRLRWMNYLRPDIKRGSLSPEEEQTIIQLHAIVGNKWSTIASYLPGRTDNEIKNIWNTHLKKRLMQSESGKNPVRHRPANSSCFSTVPATGAVNNSLLKSPTMHISHLDHDFQLLSSYSPDDNGGLQRIENNFDANNFVQVCDQGPPFADANEKFVSHNPGSSIFSSLKDSEGQIELPGAEYSTGEDIIDDQQFVSNTLWETCNADHRQTDENRSAHDYINFLKKFLDIDEESSVISPYELHQDANATFTIERHHFDNEKRTLQPYKCLSLEVHRNEDHITPAVFCWSSPFSGNQSDHEIQTSFADSQASYSYSPNSSSSNSLHVNTAPMTLSADFLVRLPEKLWQAF